jgi:hypothetical protein
MIAQAEWSEKSMLATLLATMIGWLALTYFIIPGVLEFLL